MTTFTLDIHTSTVADGNMDFRFGDEETVQKNREAFLARVGLQDTHLAVLTVSHGDVVREVSHETFAGARALSLETEALVTHEAGITLMLLTADCIPVVVFDSVRGALALAHLGWRPTVLGLAQKTIRYMETTYSSRPEDLAVYLGPSIQAPSYAFAEVTQDTPAWKPYLHPGSDGHIHVDLPGYVQSECIRCDIPESAVHLSHTDTATDTQYFSHARSKQTSAVEGRFATIATLRYADQA